MQGAWKTFTYNVPYADGSFTATKVAFDYAPLSLQYLQHACQVGLTFVEIPDPASAPAYSVTATCLRFPSAALQAALLSQVQQIVPLVHIRVRETTVPDILLSDRRCTIAGQLYLPRVLGLGEPGSDAIVSQDIRGSADNVQFAFGNADRVMTALANDTDLKNATPFIKRRPAAALRRQLRHPAADLVGLRDEASPPTAARSSPCRRAMASTRSRSSIRRAPSREPTGRRSTTASSAPTRRRATAAT